MRIAEKLSRRLIRQGYNRNCRIPSKKDLDEWFMFAVKHNLNGFEGWFLPEDQLYPKVLEKISPNDIILDVGAGNLALDIRISEKAEKVYAVELNPVVISEALKTIKFELPRNLIVVCGNALDFPIPGDVNTLLILVRHFSHEIPDGWLELPKLLMNIGGQFIVIDEKGTEIINNLEFVPPKVRERLREACMHE